MSPVTPPNAVPDLACAVGAAAARPSWVQEAFAGTVGTLATLVVPITLGLLAFSALGLQSAGMGVLAGLSTAVVGGVVYGLLGRAALPVAGPSSATALILAALIVQLAADPASAADPSGHVLRTVAIAGLTVMLCGLVQVAIALLGLAGLARYVPQPVLAGFMNGVALLIVIGQLPLLLGRSAGTPVATWLAAWHPLPGVLGLLTVVTVVGMTRRWPHAPAALVALLLGTAAYHLLLAVWPAAAVGRTVGPLPDGLPTPAVLWPLFVEGGLDLLHRHAGAVVGAALALALVGAMESALNTLALDRARNTGHAPGRELLSLGIANMACGACGGLPAVALRARAQGMLLAGGQGPRAAIGGSVVVGAMALFGGHWLALLPLPVLAGIMLTVAWTLLDRWTFGLLRQWWSGGRSRELRSSLAVVALVCVVTVWQGFVVAVAVGVLLSMLLFMARMNRSLVRSRCTAAAQPSRRIYAASIEQRLQPLRAQVLVLELEGVLFFGSSDRLLSDAQAHGSPVRCVVLDLTRVGDIDDTGVLALQQLQDRLEHRGVSLRLAGVMAESPRAALLRNFGCTAEFWPDSDRAVEAAEHELLGADADATFAPVPLAACSLLHGLDGNGLALVLPQLRRQALRPGALLFAAGADADCLYLLTAGSVSVVSTAEPGAAQHRYLSLSPGMMFGETAMLDGLGRSAGVVADSDAVVHALTRTDLDALSAEHPQLAAQLYRNMALHLSQRLRSAAAAWQASTQPVAAGTAKA